MDSLLVVVEGERLNARVFSAPAVWESQRGTVPKRNTGDSVNKLQYFPRNSLGCWKQPYQCCIILLFWKQYKSVWRSTRMPPSWPLLGAYMSMLLLLMCCVGAPFSPWEACFWSGGHSTVSFWLAENTCLSTLKLANGRLQSNLSGWICVFLFWRVIGTGSTGVSLLGEQTTFTLLFWCFKAGSQLFCAVHGNYQCVWGGEKPLLWFSNSLTSWYMVPGICVWIITSKPFLLWWVTHTAELVYYDAGMTSVHRDFKIVLVPNGPI